MFSRNIMCWQDASFLFFPFMPSQNAVLSQEGNMEEKEMNDRSQIVRSQVSSVLLSSEMLL